MLQRWLTLSTRIVMRNTWWAYLCDEFEIPGRYSGEYHYVHTNGSSMVVPVTDDGRLVLVRQYRYLGKRDSLEFPCGSVKDGHDYAQTGHLELEEEAGFRAGVLQTLGDFNPYNGVTDEICRVFLAQRLTATTARPDPTEEFEIVFRSPTELDTMIGSGEVWDGMTLAAWALARHRIMPVE